MHGRILKFLGVGILPLAAFLAGCSTADEYAEDSNGGAVLALSSPDSAVCAVTVEKVDHAGAGMWRRGSHEFSAGAHSVAITIVDYAQNDPQPMGGKNSLKAEESVDVTLAAGHRYRFEATRTGTDFDLTLWDETLAERKAVQHWTLDATKDLQPFNS